MLPAGIFELIAAIMIFVMGVTMLKMDRAKAKWRVKLQKAFDGQRGPHIFLLQSNVLTGPLFNRC